MPQQLTVWVCGRRALSGMCMNGDGLDAQMVDGTRKPIGHFVMMGSWHNEPEWPLLEMPAIELSVYLAPRQVSHTIGIWGGFVVGWTMCREVWESSGTRVLPSLVDYYYFSLIKQEQIFINMFC